MCRALNGKETPLESRTSAKAERGQPHASWWDLILKAGEGPFHPGALGCFRKTILATRGKEMPFTYSYLN
jgi:hypothetical protein